MRRAVWVGLAVLVAVTLACDATASAPFGGQRTPVEAAGAQAAAQATATLAMPVTISGQGDEIIEVTKGDGPALIHITGNAASRHFGVENYDRTGRQIDLLVNTTEPYDGIRPLDFLDGQHTARLKVTATGSWMIEIFPVGSARDVLQVPGSFSGEGDSVVVLSGSKPDLAHIQGNPGGRYFGVTGYGRRPDLLVNTVDPYQGTVIVQRDTLALVVVAEGPWSIEVTAR